MAVAGFLSDNDTWSGFDREWRIAMTEYGLPFFHMKEFAADEKSYATWSDSTKKRRLKHLLDLIERYRLLPFGVAIPYRLFDQFVSDVAKERCGGAYGLAAQGCFNAVVGAFGDYLRNEGHTVAWIFERGARGYAQVDAAFKRNWNNPLMCMETIGTVSKRDSPGVQAADILAYEMYQQLPVVLGWEATANTRYPWRRLVKMQRGVTLLHLDRESLRWHSDRIEAAAS